MYLTAKPIKAGVANLYGLTGKENPWYATFTAATLSGICVALTSAVPDLYKTSKQKAKASNDSFYTMLKTNYKQHGINGAFVGVRLKTAMIILGWGVTFAITQRDEVEKKPDAKKVLANNPSAFKYSGTAQIKEENVTPQMGIRATK